MKKLLLLALLPVCGWSASKDFQDGGAVIYNVRVEFESVAVTSFLSNGPISDLKAFRSKVNNIPSGEGILGEFLVENGLGIEWGVFVGNSELKTNDDLVWALSNCDLVKNPTGETIRLLTCKVESIPIQTETLDCTHEA